MGKIEVEGQMIEENGHIWEESNSNSRCQKCQMKFGYYLDIKHASEQQPEREDLKEWMKCEKAKTK